MTTHHDLPQNPFFFTHARNLWELFMPLYPLTSEAQKPDQLPNLFLKPRIGGLFVEWPIALWDHGPAPQLPNQHPGRNIQASGDFKGPQLLPLQKASLKQKG